MADKFTPDHVTLLDSRYGKVPYELGAPIIQDIMKNSAVMQLAKPVPMSKAKKSFPILSEGLSGYRVDEGARIGTSRPIWTDVSMNAWKMGVIIPVTREYLHYKMPEFFAFMRPLIADAFYKLFDEEAIFGGTRAFVEGRSIRRAVEGSNPGGIVKAAITSTSFDAALDALGDKGWTPNAVLSKVANTSKLKAMVRKSNGITTPLYDRTSETVDGLPVVNVSKDIKSFENGTLILGDFNQAIYGIPYNMHFAVSHDATLTTMMGSDTSSGAPEPPQEPVNLFEREMSALRVTMDVAFTVINPDAFYIIEPETPKP